MTGKEIIEVLKNSATSVSDFAHEDVVEAPESFIGSEPSESNYRAYLEADAKVKAHKDHDNSYSYYGGSKASPEYLKLKEERNAIPSYYEQRKKDYLEATGIGEFKEVEQEGGEGQGDSWHSIKYFPKHNIYLMVHGWYSSGNGTDFGDWDSAVSVVAPKEKTITVYE